jgi:hypothetical protein
MLPAAPLFLLVGAHIALFVGAGASLFLTVLASTVDSGDRRRIECNLHISANVLE